LLPGAEGKQRCPERSHPRIPKDTEIKTGKQIAEETTDWKEIQYGYGENGPLKALFTRVKVRVVDKYTKWNRSVHIDEAGWLVLEKGSDGLKGYFCWGLDNYTLEELAKLIHHRWAIELYHKDIKNWLGFGHYEGRKWKGWYHHATLVQAAYAFLSWIRWKCRQIDDNLMPTLPEVLRNLRKLVVKNYRMDSKRLIEFLMNLTLSTG
jgi:hypothetical protein